MMYDDEMDYNTYNSSSITNGSAQSTNAIDEHNDTKQEQPQNKLQRINDRLDKKTTSLAQKLIREQTLEGVQDLTHLFNVAHAKKQVLRNITYNQLLDKITEQMSVRLEKRADQFSNKDLLDYAKVVQDGIDKAQKQIQTVDAVPAIQINNNTQNNLILGNGDEQLDRDSRERIMNAAKAVMQHLIDSGQFQMNNNEEIVSELVYEPEEIDEISDEYEDEQQFNIMTDDDQ